jgi:hypothetical protein
VDNYYEQLKYQYYHKGGKYLKNKYRIDGDKVFILLRNKKGVELETVIDVEYLEKVSALNCSWHLIYEKDNDSYYCKSTLYHGKINGKPEYKTIYLHQIIKPVSKEGTVIHHKNHITLDNREENLEEVSVWENVVKRKGANKNSTTGVRNVSYSKVTKKYTVQFQVNGKNKIFGIFDNLESAKICAEENREKVYKTY